MEILNLVHVVVIFATFLCTENNSWLESHEIDKFGEHPDNRDSTLVHAKKKFYGYWSQCSTSCGSGYQRWICISGMDECRSNETRPCFIKFCPSYLSFPRMHFYGQFTADVNTINNVRCNYVNKRFTAPNIKEDIEILTRKDAVTRPEL
uniref:uncharacterized protein LOC120333844 n=1 Tax=Styela clava TaxID=7725 RepID=UPI0019396F23|nr:uncharacterized protein LOC120333844 [Styela clava]XP_039257165.1 uncharacterized protein LOC120333844 [Styela clava]